MRKQAEAPSCREVAGRSELKYDSTELVIRKLIVNNNRLRKKAGIERRFLFSKRYRLSTKPLKAPNALMR